MANSTLITDYVARGLDADKPTAAPSVASGAASSYYATDTNKLYEWDGTAWTVLAGGGASPTGADPTATASDTAVNGTATTFMRSDAAPAVQLASATQFGLVKPDGTTITATGGVISAVGGGTTIPNAADQTASYTLALTDAGKFVNMNVASANNLTVPPNSSVAFPTDTVIYVRQKGAGQTTVVAGAGVTINTPETLVMQEQWATVTLHKIGTDEWCIDGRLVPAA